MAFVLRVQELDLLQCHGEISGPEGNLDDLRREPIPEVCRDRPLIVEKPVVALLGVANSQEKKRAGRPPMLPFHAVLYHETTTGNTGNPA